MKQEDVWFTDTGMKQAGLVAGAPLPCPSITYYTGSNSRSVAQSWTNEQACNIIVCMMLYYSAHDVTMLYYSTA